VHYLVLVGEQVVDRRVIERATLALSSIAWPVVAISWMNRMTRALRPSLARDPELVAAYVATSYIVDTPNRRTVLRVGQRNRVFEHLLALLEPIDALLDGLKVGQRAAEPPVVHIEHAAPLGLFANRILRLFLRADE
jgi:hypothetical protein